MDQCTECNDAHCLEMVPSQYDAMEFECCICAQEPMCDNCIERAAEVAGSKGFKVKIE